VVILARYQIECKELRLESSYVEDYNGIPMITNDYQAALDYLYSHADYSVERSYRYSAEVFELQRVRDLLAELDNPQDQFQSFHIAGTKGKGSVSALIASVLKAAGYRTGLYTSPHLIRFNERIRIDGNDIPDDDFVATLERMKPHIEAIAELTVYEIVTALAFAYFAEQGVQYASIEVGLGGRLDATNVIHPLVAVITSLSYDHMHLLGDRLSDIAREKAGIIKSGVPVVLAPQQLEAEHVVITEAEKCGARLVRVGKNWLFAPGSRHLHGQSLFVWSADEQALMDAYVDSAGEEEWSPPRYKIPLLGYHQVINAAVAYAALMEAKQLGLKLPDGAVREGFQDVHWPGRFQILNGDPVIVVDSAHNRDSALKLRLALDDYYPGQPVTLIFGASADKDIEGMLSELLPRVTRLIVTKADHPRAEEPEMIERVAHSHGVRVETQQPITQAVNRAIEMARPGEVILICGSLFVAGGALQAWNEGLVRLSPMGEPIL
jgi:dihydrofolate synthase/folylpolyglutamate synthase